MFPNPTIAGRDDDCMGSFDLRLSIESCGSRAKQLEGVRARGNPQLLPRLSRPMGFGSLLGAVYLAMEGMGRPCLKIRENVVEVVDLNGGRPRRKSGREKECTCCLWESHECLSVD